MLHYDERKPLSRTIEGATQQFFRVFVMTNGQKIGQDTTIMNRTARKILPILIRSEKRKDVVRYEAQSNSGPASSKTSTKSQVQCFACREKRHTSYTCPRRRVNLVELEEMLLEPTYDEYVDEEEDVDICPVK